MNIKVHFSDIPYVALLCTKPLSKAGTSGVPLYSSILLLNPNSTRLFELASSFCTEFHLILISLLYVRKQI